MIPNRFTHVKKYISLLEENIIITNKHDKHKLKCLSEAFNKKYFQAKTYLSLKVCFFLLLYASVVSTFLGSIPMLSDVSSYLLTVSGLLGTTILLVVLGVLHIAEGNIYSDLLMLSTHIVSIYVHNDRIEHPEIQKYLREMHGTVS